MTKLTWRRARVLTLGAVIACLLVSLPLAAQDPWSRMPAFPKTCYDNSQPGYVGELSTIRHALVVASDKQEELNTSIRQQQIDLSPQDMQSRMMAFMTKNPAEAGKVMQEMATAGQTQTAAMERLAQKKLALDEQLQTAEAQYTAEYAPLQAIAEQYRTEVNKPGFGDAARARQLLSQFDAAYEKHCAKWLLTDSSPLRQYLEAYRRFLTTEQIPLDESMVKQQKVQFDMYGIKNGEYRSTATHKAVTEYIDKVTTVFGRLSGRPVSEK